ncbi:MAG: sensor histidine kinase, partial [Sphingobacterium sp.]
MKQILILLFSLLLAVTTINAQKGIDFSHRIGAGEHVIMSVDSSAKNVHYSNKFLNQPNYSFNFLPEVQQVNIQSYFKKTDSIQNFRYTVLVDNKPIAVNQSYDLSQLKDGSSGDEEIYSTFSYGDLPIHNKIIT